jgi:hypothetical protein
MKFQVLDALTAFGALYAAYAAVGSFREARKQSEYERRPFLRLQWKAAQQVMKDLNIPVPEDFITRRKSSDFTDIEIINNGRGLAKSIFIKSICFDEGGEYTDPENATVSFKRLVVIPAGGGAQLRFSDQTNEVVRCMLSTPMPNFGNHPFQLEIGYQDVIGDCYEAVFQKAADDADGFRLIKQEKI